MADVQAQFDEFHGNIRLGRFDEEATLREKRDILRERLEDRLPSVFEKHGEEIAKFEFRDQGSYAFGTGIRPTNGDYDIDQGVYFVLTRDDYRDPVDLKSRVFEALEGHTKSVRIRQPCVTVFYERAGESEYHVDFAIYVSEWQAGSSPYVLGQGREGSNEENRFWEPSDQDSLKDRILNRFHGSDRDQFRHVVRYFKRWKDHNFSLSGYAAPRGIGLTVAVWDDFSAKYKDSLSGKHDDLAAMRYVVNSMLNRFVTTWDMDENRSVRRLEARLPVQPQNDLFSRMTTLQMEKFELRLKLLKEALDGAANDVDPVEACKKLQKVFGPDFPVPEPKETASKSMRAIISSSNSG